MSQFRITAEHELHETELQYPYIPPITHCMVCLERCGADLCEHHTAVLRRSRAAYDELVRIRKENDLEGWARWLREESEWAV